VIPFVAVLVALACAAASARRVWFAANATALHPEDIHAALASAKGPEAITALRELVANEPDADWERELLDALTAPVAHRIALVNEQLTELDYRIQRWARVPRVCASIATSFGFMLATLVLRKGLADTGDVPIEVGEMVLKGLVADALMVGAMGLIGTAFCIGAQSEAKRIAKGRSVGADKLVERLEELLLAEPETWAK
jgi:hypothetical protein